MAKDSKGVYLSSLELIREVKLSFGNWNWNEDEVEDCFGSEIES